MMSELTGRQIKHSTLFELIQNDALSVIALQSFTLGYYNIARSRSQEIVFPKLEYMFFVLPIVYNYSSMLSFLTSNELYTALTKEPAIVLGLQERAKKMTSKTFNGLNLAFSKKVLTITSENTIRLLRPFSSKKLPISKTAYNSFNSVKKIQDSAYRLGCVFAKRHDKNIQLDLNIRF